MEHGTGGDGLTQVLQAIAGLRQDLKDHIQRTDERLADMDQRLTGLTAQTRSMNFYVHFANMENQVTKIDQRLFALTEQTRSVATHVASLAKGLRATADSMTPSGT